MKLNFLTAAELMQRIRRKSVTVEEICRDCLKWISSKEKEVRAWEYLDQDLIMARAREIDRKKTRGALQGIPVGVKDIFNTNDMPTAMGSPIWKGFMPGNDARAVHNIRVRDGLIFGKTVTAEFAVHYLPKNKTRNPHHLSHTPGTSSSGSAAAVAASMVPVALGTQTAGSIVRPASYCGIYGFKPTFGTVARTGTLKTTDTLDTVGCFARSVEDIRIVFDAIRVQGADYPLVHENLDGRDASFLRKRRKKVRVGIISEGMDVFTHFEKYVFDQFNMLVTRLSRYNELDIVKIRPSRDVNRIHHIHSVLYDKTLSYYFKKEFKQKTLISEIMYEIIERGSKISLADYTRAMESQVRIRASMNEKLQNYDIILTPSTAGEPPRAGEREKPDTCLVWTFLGYPSLSMPAFRGPHHLPIGLQVIAKRYDDHKLLSISEQILAKEVQRSNRTAL